MCDSVKGEKPQVEMAIRVLTQDTTEKHLWIVNRDMALIPDTCLEIEVEVERQRDRERDREREIEKENKIKYKNA